MHRYDILYVFYDWAIAVMKMHWLTCLRSIWQVRNRLKQNLHHGLHNKG